MPFSSTILGFLSRSLTPPSLLPRPCYRSIFSLGNNSAKAVISLSVTGDSYQRATLDSDGIFRQYAFPKDELNTWSWEVQGAVARNICRLVTKWLERRSKGFELTYLYTSEKEILDVAVSQKLQESQPEMDLHALSRKQNDQIIEGLFEPPRKGRRRFRGSGSRASTDTSTTFESTRPSMPCTMQPPDESQKVLKLRSRVIAMLSDKLDPTVFVGIIPLIFGDIGTPRLTNAIAHIVHSLKGKIPDDIYVDVITSITATYDSNVACAQSREGAGSTSARPAREDVVDLGVHDGGEE